MNPFRMNMTFLAIVLISTGAFAAGLLFPGLRELDHRRSAIAGELDHSQQLQSVVGNVSDLYSNVLELRRDEHLLWQRIPMEPKFGDFLNSLSQCLTASRIEGYEIQPEPARDVDPSSLPESFKLASNITVLPVSLKFDSDFRSVFDLIERIEHVDRLIHIESLRLFNDEKSPGRVRVEMTVQAYHRRVG